MSFFDNFGVECLQCKHTLYVDRLRDEFAFVCPNCGNKMTVKFSKVPNKKRGRPDVEINITSGCTVVDGTF